MRQHRKIILALAVFGAAIAAASFYAWRIYSGLQAKNVALEEELTAREHDISELEEVLTSLRADLEREREEKRNLAQELYAEKSKNSVFESQIRDLSLTVRSLQKLSQTDPELLKKYSKVYFLSENYAPAQLSSINSRYLYDTKRPQLIHSGVLPYLEALLAAAERDGIKLRIISGYRTFYEQAALKFGYKVTYGSGANQFSADQGYSEHQLGTAVDFTTPDVGGAFSKFEASAAYKWLENNAYKYGFILSYPKGNQYYQFEPWHWRFVGVALATKLHNSNAYFYNLSQREIDEYLISIFD